MRWRWNYLLTRWLLVWSVKIHPSPLQKEFNRGDPNGVCQAIADRILAEIDNERDTNHGH